MGGRCRARSDVGAGAAWPRRRTPAAGAAQVFLGPGDGVDVDPGTEPLVIKRWPQPRVDALLARLGQ
jgi:hypothetical protein